MNRKILVLTLIVILGFLLRFWQISGIPPGLNRDEASIGYTAYSLLKTGKDEYGKSWPISFKSFGDWKLPLYIYLDILPVKFLSLTETSVRIPSVIFGTATILLVYFLCLKLFQSNKSRYFIAILTTFLFAISPWAVHFSRESSEANISVFFICLGLLFFIYGLSSQLFLIISSVVFSLSLFTYHGNHIFTPLFVLGLIFILFKVKRSIKQIALFLLPFAILSSIIFALTLFSADRTKISGLTPLNDTYNLYAKVNLARLDHLNPKSIYPQLLHNKYTYLMGSFFINYWRSFSPEFLFIRGGDNLQHNIPDFGNLYMWETSFIIFGLYFLFKNKLQWQYFLLFWLLISAIPASITKDAPHSARMLSILPLPEILAAVGFIYFFKIFKVYKIRNKILMVAGGLLIINYSLFLDRYFIHFPKIREAVWGSGYKQLISSVNPLTPSYSKIVMDRPDYSPYIYFLFYEKVDPDTYQHEVIRYPEDNEGFQHVKSFGKLEFKKMDWTLDLLVPNRLLITWVDSTPPNATNSASIIDKLTLQKITSQFGQTFGLTVGDEVETTLINTVRLSSGQPQFYMIETKRIPKKSLSL